MAKKTHKPGNKGRRGGTQPGAGRPLRPISAAELEEIEGYALAGAQNGTICELMGWDHEWLLGRQDILQKLTKKRCERKLIILRGQNERAEAGSDTMLIWQGKQHLGQADKQETKHGLSTTLVEFLKEIK
jgi:hypothetical protein